MKKIFAIMPLILCLSGCVLFPTKPEIKEIPIPARYTQSCPELPTVTDPLSMGGLMVEYKNLQQQYTDCATNHDGLIEIVKPKGKQ